MFLNGVRQAELVDKTGIDKGSLSSYVNGRYMPNADKIAKIATALGVSVNFLLGKEEIPIAKFTLPQFHDVPVLGSVAAGTPILAQEDVIGTVMTDKDVFALKVKGDSMSPRIMDGDIVLVRQQDAAEDGDLVIAEIDGEATCKVLKRSHSSVMLVPFNAAFTPIVYTGQEAEDLRILGKVVESRHEW
jgi:repressor LexA